MNRRIVSLGALHCGRWTSSGGACRRHRSLATTAATTTPAPESAESPSKVPDLSWRYGRRLDYQTQPEPVYSLPYYGAPREVLEQLPDEKVPLILKEYGGLIRKSDTIEELRERLMKATNASFRPKQLTMEGHVISDKMDKSVVVAVRRRRWEPKLKLAYEKTRRFKAHDERNLCKEGDRVIIRSCRPLSKEKNHVVVVNYGDERKGGTDDRRIDIE